MILITEDNHIKMIDYKNQYARQFSKDTHLGMVTKAETKEELDKYYREYLNMTIKQKFKANNMALRIFGMTNDELYQLYRKDFVKDDYNSYVHLGYNGFEPIDNDDSKDDLKDYIKDTERELDDKQDLILGIDRDNIPNEINNEIIVRDIDRDTFVGRIQESMDLECIEEEQAGLVNISFFTPTEILSFGEDFYSSTPDNTNLTEDIPVSQWFTNYVESFNGHVCENLSVEWNTKMRSLYSDYNKILESGDEDVINNRKQSILNLGWNPEIDFNEKNMLVAKQRLQEASKLIQDVYKDYSDITISEDTVLTESIDETKYSGVFIVLTKGETPIVSDSISFFTNSDYTHAGIAFDPELDEIYSFNMRRDSRGKNGFVIENIRNDKSIQSVFVLFVERGKVKEMISQVKDFEIHKTTYDFGLLVGKAVSAKHNDKDSKKYNQVCSSFVDTILHYGEIEFVQTKNKSIASPADIYNSISKTSNKIFKIFEGSGKSYDSNKSRRILDSLMKHSKTKAYTEDYIEEKAKPNLCYKVIYEGSSDIFQELKMKMFNEDRGMKSYENFYEKKCSWMKPDGAKGKIFLKEKGLKKFKKEVLPTINAYLDKTKVKVSSYSIENDKITYSDDFVIATSKALTRVNEDTEIAYEDTEYVRESYSTIGMYIEEDANALLDKNDWSQYIDKWESGEKNLLFITGMSGSGKTTLGKKICKEYNAEFIEMDVLMRIAKKESAEEYVDHPIIVEYVKSKGGPKKIYPELQKLCDSKPEKDISMDEQIAAMNLEHGRFFKYIKQYANNHKYKKFVIEGVWIYMYDDMSVIFGYPLIIKGTPSSKCDARRLFRSLKSKRPIPEKVKHILDVLKYNYIDTREKKYSIDKFDEYKKDMKMESYIEESLLLPSGYSTRKATNNDTDYIFKCEIDSLDPSIKNNPNYKTIQYIKDDVKKSIKNTTIITYKGNPVGILTAASIDEGEYWYIGEIYLDKEHRNKGIGTTLLKDQISKHNKIKLRVLFSNTKAKKLYEALGFTVYKKEDENKSYVMILDKTKTVQEAISMDDEGNMLIYRATLNTINYGDEIKKSADLCKLYKDSSNLEGLKYELCKLWYINAMLEKRIKRNDDNKNTYMNHRRVCLNIFKTYMKHVLILDDDFNFEAYYNSTPYGGAIRIDKNTLKYSVKAIKELMR